MREAVYTAGSRMAFVSWGKNRKDWTGSMAGHQQSDGSKALVQSAMSWIQAGTNGVACTERLALLEVPGATDGLPFLGLPSAGFDSVLSVTMGRDRVVGM
jgi:hypothetical protein